MTCSVAASGQQPPKHIWIVMVKCVLARARNRSYATASHIFHINRSPKSLRHIKYVCLFVCDRRRWWRRTPWSEKKEMRTSSENQKRVLIDSKIIISVRGSSYTHGDGQCWRHFTNFTTQHFLNAFVVGRSADRSGGEQETQTMKMWAHVLWKHYK